MGSLTRRRFGGAVAAVSILGALDDAFSGPERGWRAHLESGRTTGVLKLLGIPLVGTLATRFVSGGLLVGLSANALNLFDTKPGRALKAFLVTAPGSDFAPVAILLLPYDLREKSMLGDAGSNALGAGGLEFQWTVSTDERVGPSSPHWRGSTSSVNGACSAR